MVFNIFTDVLPIDPQVELGVMWSNSDNDSLCMPGEFSKSYPGAWKYDELHGHIGDSIGEGRLKFSDEIRRWEGTYPIGEPIEDLHALSEAPDNRNVLEPLRNAAITLSQLKDPSLHLITCGIIVYLTEDCSPTLFTTNETWFAFVKMDDSEDVDWYIDTAKRIAYTEKKIKELHILQGNDTYGMTMCDTTDDQVKNEASNQD